MAAELVVLAVNSSDPVGYQTKKFIIAFLATRSSTGGLAAIIAGIAGKFFVANALHTRVYYPTLSVCGIHREHASIATSY